MASKKIRVYITIDTETSLGGAWRNPAYLPLGLDRTVFGNYGSRSYGIPLIMDILEEYGFRGTFFTEVFCSLVLGGEEVRRVFRLIQDRGHDAQLHLHPIYRFYSDRAAGQPAREIDLMHQLSPDEQRALIREGVTIFGELCGKAPRAYRAGCYGASEVTLLALRENGVEIDSSYNMAYLSSTCGFRTNSLNAPVVINGVYEFPVTVFSVVGFSGYKPLEISAVSVGEILTTIRSLATAGCQDIVLSLHSFSLLKNRKLRYDRYRPDRIVIQRLRRLCAALSDARDEIEVVTLGESDLSSVPVPQPQFVPSAGLVRPAFRKLVQGVNRLSWV